MSRPLASGAGLLAIAVFVLILWPSAAPGGQARLATQRAMVGTFDVKPLACIVPAVKGRTLARAKAEIRSSLCGVGTVRRAFSGKVKKGHVISQSPQALSRLKRGTKVDLVVSRGRR
jgi:serine/threonine-protein kinase